jgi:acyl-CoA dehydrogenase
MSDTSFLGWPFFDDFHRALARRAEDWWRREGVSLPDPEGREAGTAARGDVGTACREIVRRLGAAGWLRYVVPAAHASYDAYDESAAIAAAAGGGPPRLPSGSSKVTGVGSASAEPAASPAHAAGTAARTGARTESEAATGRAGAWAGGVPATNGIDVRSLCLLRETFARGSALADFAFAMQGLGSGPLSLFGSEAQRREYLPRVAAGQAIAAFALSEAEAGSDVSAMRATARRDGGGWVLDGQKTWISNAGIADFYVVFCRLQEGGDRSYGAFVVDADRKGLHVTERFDVTAPHPLGTIELAGCRVPGGALIGEPGRGLRVALATLDAFRPTVGAAALGLARRALDEAVAHVERRRVFGQALADHQLTQAKLADMATAIDASALLVYRAAWARDRGGAARVTREAAMAKLFATEAAQRVVDEAVQLLGARGVLAGGTVERLYREVRALRIYEGTSEIQRLVIAGQVLAAGAGAGRAAGVDSATGAGGTTGPGDPTSAGATSGAAGGGGAVATDGRARPAAAAEPGQRPATGTES